ncbi:MAG: phosphatase [Eubacteriales bacterium]
MIPSYFIDLHTHSIASGHGSMHTIAAMANSASQKGLQILGLSDHGPTTPDSASLSYFQGLILAPKKRENVNILYGVEANIIDTQGTLDLPNSTLSTLDYCIASMHLPNIDPSSEQINTATYIAAMENPHVSIIGHCDDVRYPVDFTAMIKAAIKNHVLLEINNASLAPDSYRGYTRPNAIHLLNLHKKYDYPVLLSSDSHSKDHIGDFSYILPLLQETNFPPNLILNDKPDQILKFINK